jgi:hypothetical protein
MRDRRSRSEPPPAATYDHPDEAELFRELSESGIPEDGICRACSAAGILAPVLQELLWFSDEMSHPPEDERFGRPSSFADHEFNRARP